MRQTIVMEKFLYIYQKNGGKIEKEFLDFPVLIKEILKKNNIKPKGYGTFFYNGAMINYILNDGKITQNITPCKLNKKSYILPEIEKYILSINSFDIKEYKKKLKKLKSDEKKKKKKEIKRHINNQIYLNLANSFYNSPEWRKIRYEVLREQGGRCQCCGRSAKDGIILHVDHIVPLSKDWSKRLDKNNLQVLCEDCNLGKSNTDSIDWRKH